MKLIQGFFSRAKKGSLHRSLLPLKVDCDTNLLVRKSSTKLILELNVGIPHHLLSDLLQNAPVYICFIQIKYMCMYIHIKMTGIDVEISTMITPIYTHIKPGRE